MKDTIQATHKVSFYGVPCYWNCHSNDLWGINLFCDFLILVVTAIHNIICFVCPGAGENGFPFRILEEYGSTRGQV